MTRTRTSSITRDDILASHTSRCAINHSTKPNGRATVSWDNTAQVRCFAKPVYSGSRRRARRCNRHTPDREEVTSNMGRMAPSLTSVDCLRLQRYVTLPGILGGSVAPNPRFWPYLVRKQSAATTIKFFLGLQKKYGRRAWSWFPFGRTLLVLDGDGINEVLSSSENFADPFIKKLQLSAFTPHGAIISRPLPWEGRRALNDEALAFGQLCHPDGELFAAIAHDEVEKMLEARRELLAWHDFGTLAARISQQVILGIGQYREDVAMHLARLVSASNWGVIRRPADFSALHGCIDEQVNRRGPVCREWHSLVQRAVSGVHIQRNYRCESVQSDRVLAFRDEGRHRTAHGPHAGTHRQRA